MYYNLFPYFCIEKKLPKRLKGSRLNLITTIYMKHLFQWSFALILLTVVLGSCKKATFIYSSEQVVQFPKTGGEKQITVSSDGSWNIENCPEWLKVEVKDSILMLNIGLNESGAPREGTLELVGGEAKASITVKQADVCTRLIASTEKVTFPKEGGTETIIIDTDGGDVKVEAKEGVTAEYNNGKLTLTTPANGGGTINGTVNLTCDEQATTINFTVEGSICPTCNGTGKVKCSKCGGKGSYYSDYVKADFGCKNCGGRGSIEHYMGPDLAWNGDDNFQISYGFRKGSGKMPCPTCGGLGH